MAIQKIVVGRAVDGKVEIDMSYDDVSLDLTEVGFQNLSNGPADITISDPVFGTFTRTLAAGTPRTVYAIPSGTYKLTRSTVRGRTSVGFGFTFSMTANGTA